MVAESGSGLDRASCSDWDLNLPAHETTEKVKEKEVAAGTCFPPRHSGQYEF